MWKTTFDRSEVVCSVVKRPYHFIFLKVVYIGPFLNEFSHMVPVKTRRFPYILTRQNSAFLYIQAQCIFIIHVCILFYLNGYCFAKIMQMWNEIYVQNYLAFVVTLSEFIPLLVNKPSWRNLIKFCFCFYVVL